MKYNFFILIITLFILQSCGAGTESSSGTSQSILDDLNKEIETSFPENQETEVKTENKETEHQIVLDQFNSICDTDYSHSYQTEFFVNDTFNIILYDLFYNNEIHSDEFYLIFNHKKTYNLIDNSPSQYSESIQIAPCNDTSKAIAEHYQLKKKSNYHPNQIIYHFYSNPDIDQITRNTKISVTDNSNYWAILYLSGISIIIEDSTFHYKTHKYMHYFMNDYHIHPTAITYQSYHSKISKRLTELYNSLSHLYPGESAPFNQSIQTPL